jgi:hypothetical protein
VSNRWGSLQIAIFFQLFIRYQKAEIGFYDIRYDRLTGIVSIKPINSNEWIKTEFKNLRLAKAYLERRELERAVENAIDR